jgi:23S rRNA-/tRNA-specific pseudouridylate synthase
LSRSQIQRWIGEGLVRLNDHETKASARLTAGDAVLVTVPIPRPSSLEPRGFAGPEQACRVDRPSGRRKG